MTRAQLTQHISFLELRYPDRRMGAAAASPVVAMLTACDLSLLLCRGGDPFQFAGNPPSFPILLTADVCEITF